MEKLQEASLSLVRANKEGEMCGEGERQGRERKEVGCGSDLVRGSPVEERSGAAAAPGGSHGSLQGTTGRGSTVREERLEEGRKSREEGRGPACSGRGRHGQRGGSLSSWLLPEDDGVRVGGFGCRWEKWLGVVGDRGGRRLRWLGELDGSDLGEIPRESGGGAGVGSLEIRWFF